MAPHPADAAVTPGKFTGTAGASIADGTLNSKSGGGLANLNFLVSGAKISSTATPKAVSGSSGAIGMALGQPVPFAGTNIRTAGPTTGSTTGSMPAVSQQGVSVSAVTSTNTAVFTDTTGCSATTIAAATTRSSGVTVSSTAFGAAAQASWGTSSTAGSVSLAEAAGADTRAVVSKASGDVGNISILDGRFVLKVVGTSTLTATATGEPGGAKVVYQPAKITLTSPGRGEDSELIRPGDVAVKRTITFRGKTAEVTFRANNPTISPAANGQSATGKAALLTMTVAATPGGIEGSGTLNLLPLQVIATAPAGGVTCPAPAGGPTETAGPTDPTETADPTDPPVTLPPTTTTTTSGPTATSTVAAPVAVVTNPGGPTLASTGGPSGLLVLLGALLVAGGSVLVPASIRRHRHG